ncbi:MAG: LexA family transcriptional regulator [Deltaproteobacteria bacterium]|nr:LexA family transcriptional regulator [Deltaproteobacteria bacterium]
MGRRIREIRGDRSQEAFARLLGVSQGAVNHYERGRVPDGEMLLKIASLDPKRRGIEWILTGRIGAAYGGAGLTGESAPAYEILKVEDPQARLPGIEKALMAFKKIPIIEDRIAAGPLSALDFSRIEDWARVPAWKLKRNASYYMIRVTGDSMEPQLRKEDLILVNLSRRDPNRLKEKLVAAWLPDEEGATVKVLREEERGRYWILHPRNPEYRDRVVPKGLKGFQVAVVEAAWLNFG